MLFKVKITINTHYLQCRLYPHTCCWDNVKAPLNAFPISCRSSTSMEFSLHIMGSHSKVYPLASGSIQHSSSCSTLWSGGGNRKNVGWIEFSRVALLLLVLQSNASMSCWAEERWWMSKSKYCFVIINQNYKKRNWSTISEARSFLFTVEYSWYIVD